jgi:hypothetical protein
VGADRRRRGSRDHLGRRRVPAATRATPHVRDGSSAAASTRGDSTRGDSTRAASPWAASV